jgi:hypothetical protein
VVGSYCHLFLFHGRVFKSESKDYRGISVCEKINYLDRETKRLPDFSIRFLKERHEQSPMFRPGFMFYDFDVTNGTETKTVSWSSGTGDIGPTFFDFNGQRYVLELKASKAFDGFMKDGEMVVWKRGEYDNLPRRR